MHNQEKARELFRRLGYDRLPMAACVVSLDGRVLDGNRPAREMLGLAEEQGGGAVCFLRDVFPDGGVWSPSPIEGAGLPAESSGRWPVTRLSVNGCERFVHAAQLMPLCDPDSGDVVAHVGLMMDMSDEEAAGRLFDHFPVGVYRVDADEVFTYVNDATVQILGWQARDEIVGHVWSEFQIGPAEAAAFCERARNERQVIRGEVLEFIKKSGEPLYVSVSSAARVGAGGKYEGREGTLVDVTREERKRRAIEDLPLGFYELRTRGGRDILVDCNPQFCGTTAGRMRGRSKIFACWANAARPAGRRRWR